MTNNAVLTIDPYRQLSPKTIQAFKDIFNYENDTFISTSLNQHNRTTIDQKTFDNSHQSLTKLLFSQLKNKLTKTTEAIKIKDMTSNSNHHEVVIQDVINLLPKTAQKAFQADYQLTETECHNKVPTSLLIPIKQMYFEQFRNEQFIPALKQDLHRLAFENHALTYTTTLLQLDEPLNTETNLSQFHTLDVTYDISSESLTFEI